MKIINYLLAGILILSACNNAKKDNQKKENSENIEITTNQEISLLEENLTQKLIASDDPLERFKLQLQIFDIKFKKAPQERKTLLFNEFLTATGVEIDAISQKESNYLDHYYLYRMIDENGEQKSKLPDSIIQKEKLYTDAGLVFEDIGEGMVEINMDYKFLETYVKQLPDSYQEYWYLSNDSKNLAPDASLILTWKELADLIIRYEAYAEKYPQNIGFLQALADDYEFLQRAFIVGTDNSPTFYEDGQLLSELKTEWLRFSKAYPKSPTTKLIQIALAHENYDNISLYEKIEQAQSLSDDPYMNNKQ